MKPGITLWYLNFHNRKMCINYLNKINCHGENIQYIICKHRMEALVIKVEYIYVCSHHLSLIDSYMYYENLTKQKNYLFWPLISKKCLQEKFPIHSIYIVFWTWIFQIYHLSTWQDKTNINTAKTKSTVCLYNHKQIYLIKILNIWGSKTYRVTRSYDIIKFKSKSLTCGASAGLSQRFQGYDKISSVLHVCTN